MAPLPPIPPLSGTLIFDPNVSETTWTYQRGSSSVIDRGIRIRPERTQRRNHVQKLHWRNTRWPGVEGKESQTMGHPHQQQQIEKRRLTSLTVSDVGPTVAIRRILILYEKYEFHEAAFLINRLNHNTFRSIVGQLPIDLFVDALPNSLPVIEALYSKIFLSDGMTGALRMMRPSAIVWQLVHFFARQDESVAVGLLGNGGSFYISCKKLLHVICVTEPQIRRGLQLRRRALDKALAGLGQHGLVGTSDRSLMELHAALKLEFEKLIQQYKAAVQKLDELSLAPKSAVARSVSFGPAPTTASHQRQLSLKQHEIQERLIKNKTLLNVAEPTLVRQEVDVLLKILRRRIEFDKDVLLQFTQLKKEAKDVHRNAIVAPVLMRFARACEHVHSLMRDDEGDDPDLSSDISGYHSDSDSAVVMTGVNSPFISHRLGRNNLFFRSVRSNARRSPRGSGSDEPDEKSHQMENVRSARTKIQKSDITVISSNGTLVKTPEERRMSSRSPSYDREMAALRQEVEGLRCELLKHKQTIQALHDREQKMKERLAEQAQRMLEKGTKFENISLGEKRPTALIRRYGNLYTQARVDTLDALDALPQLQDAEELKAKLLFSVIVLAFRSAQSTLREIRETVRRILQMPELGSKDPAADPASREVETNIALYLRRTIDRYDVKKNIEEVCSQIWATLYDYPSLKTCEGLVRYIQDCVKLAWGLSNQTPPFVIEYETRQFRRDMHVRFHTSQLESEHIKMYLWPALLEGDNGPCVHKGIVIT